MHAEAGVSGASLIPVYRNACIPFLPWIVSCPKAEITVLFPVYLSIQYLAEGRHSLNIPRWLIIIALSPWCSLCTGSSL